MFLCCFTLLTGVRTLGITHAVLFLLGLFIAIGKHSHTEAVLTLIIYSFIVFLPAAILVFVQEFKGPIRILRKALMIASWYSLSASVFLNIVILGFVILYVSCDGSDD